MDPHIWQEASRREFFRLCLVPGVGPILRQRLLAAFGDAESVFAQTTQRLSQVDGVGSRVSASIVAARREVDIDAELARCSHHGIEVVLSLDDDYPVRLREIPAAPDVLFYRGELSGEDELAVAIVGTRKATPYGRRQADRFAGVLADRGVTVVSGMARGIDAAAHRAVLARGGRTIAVLGSGLLQVYPPEHRELFEEIAQCGVVVSEYPPLRPPKSSTFPQRNRIISGLSWGVLVVEAARQSGALVTARHAVEQNREVFALPGSIEGGHYAGCHRLLRDGAQLVEAPEEILESLGPLPHPTEHQGRSLQKPIELNLSDQERQILDAVRQDPTPVDLVIASCGLPAPRVLATLSILEMRQLVERVSGQFVVRR